MLRLTQRVGFSQFKTASDLWVSCSSPFPNPQAKGKGRQKKRLVDFQADHKLGYNDGQYIDSVTQVPKYLRKDSVRNKGRILERHHYKMDERQKDILDKLKIAEEESIQKKKIASKMAVKVRAYQLQGRTSVSYSYMGLPVPSAIPATGVDFSDYECKMLQVTRISHMTGSVGRVYGIRVILAMGNKKGSFGWACANGENLGEATKKAMLRCQTKIENYDLYKGKTVFHNVSASMVREKVDIIRQPEGYGIRGCQLMRCLANLIGLTDVYITTQSSKKNITGSPINKIRTFEKALRSIETPEQVADRTGLHVVEMDPLEYGKPKIIAEPTDFQEGDDSDIEPFDEYQAYFLTQPDQGIWVV